MKGGKEAAFGAFSTDPEEKLYYSRFEAQGALASAYYPVFTSDGEPVALAGVDLPVDLLSSSMIGFLLAVLLSVILVSAVFTSVLYRAFDRRVIKPISKLQKGMQLYRRTMDSSAATEELETIRLKNEIGNLAGSFIVLMVEIDSNTEDVARLSAEKERIATELSMAAEIQAHMLPSTFPAFPERKEFEIYAAMTPAKEVGGDFYDFFMVDEDHLALVMADVSGKGVPAALFMMTSRTMLKDTALSGLDPAAVLERVNARICENNPDYMFVTVWMGILELSTGRLIWADAGHEQPVLLSGGEWKMLSKGGGPALGAFEPEILELEEKPPFCNREIFMRPGDIIFQYTDGVTEATNPQREQFGTGRIIEAASSAPNIAPNALVEHISAQINAFVHGAPQFDDITMLALRYRGNGLVNNEI